MKNVILEREHWRITLGSNLRICRRSTLYECIESGIQNGYTFKICNGEE